MCPRIFLVAAALAFAWGPFAAGNAATPCYIATYADPMHCDVNTFTGGDVYMVDVWIWVKPSDVGLKAIEFSLGHPSGAYAGEVYTNPDILLELGDLQSGVSAVFGPCQTDWVWIHRQVYYVFSTETRGYFMINGHPAAAPYFKQYASCEEGFPIYPMEVSGYLALNQCAYICGCWPRIQTVRPFTYDKVRVDFGACVGTYGEPFTGNFHLFVEGSSVEALDVAAAQRISDGVFDLTLNGLLTDGTTYVLVAQDIPECEGGCNWIESSSRKFHFDSAIATLLQAHNVSVVDGAVELEWTLSEVDPGARFLVSRSEDGGAFEALAGTPSEVARLSYRYLDSGVEPGHGYTYRIEYSAVGGRQTLFTSDRIAIPAAALALHQNVPNPFNPRTKISFTLPEAHAVTLEIYDVSGHLVTQLFDGERLPGGTHAIDWNGVDGAGNAVSSGIYLYRIQVGKTSLSRKMVLLR
jgi:hypothetical protein